MDKHCWLVYVGLDGLHIMLGKRYQIHDHILLNLNKCHKYQLKIDMRFHIFEFEDQPWLPVTIRDGMTDFLQFVLGLMDFYKPVALTLKTLMHHTGDRQVIDLCSGGGGYAAQLQKHLSKVLDEKAVIVLTDKYPNISKFKYLKSNSLGRLDFVAASVDATNVPSDLKGLRTMFSAAHHFKCETLKEILDHAANSKSSIAIFDGGNKNILMIIALLFLFPILFVCCTPFIKPFKWSRLLFTYIIPLIPLLTLWDGAVSVLRLYSVKELDQIAQDLHSASYIWQSGTIPSSFGMKINFLIGYPIKDVLT